MKHKMEKNWSNLLYFGSKQAQCILYSFFYFRLDVNLKMKSLKACEKLQKKLKLIPQ